jgi:hypothetical protein
MPINYLKNPSSTTGLSSALQTSLSNIPYKVTISNALPSTSTVTGALVVTGGVGVAGNIFARSFTASANVVANIGRFAGGINTSSIISSSITNSGDIRSATASITTVTSTDIASTRAGINTLTVGISLSAPAATITGATITTLTGTTGNIATVNATTVNTNLLRVNTLRPRTGSTVDLGNVGNLVIAGGDFNQVLTTDGSGRLTWSDGVGSFSTGYGITKTGSQLALASINTTPGTYSQVTVNEYGQVLSGSAASVSLQSVSEAGSTTDRVITFSNTTDSTDVTNGGVVVQGGLGVGLTLTANDLRVLNTTTFEIGFNSLRTSTMAGTLLLQAQATGEVPLTFASGALTVGPATGSVEFDGDYLYLMTRSGRQVIQSRQTNIAPSYLLPARATSAYSVNISNPQQNINGVDQWDDITLNAFDRVLLQNQSNPQENGIYIWTSAGTPLLRAPDANSVTGIYSGTLILVTEGTIEGGSIWRLETTGTIVVGTTPLLYSHFVDRDSIAISQLPTDSSAGIIARTTYGSVALRSVVSSSSFITVSNGSGAAGNITINTGVLPVTNGGTGRSSFFGYLRGIGTATTSSNTIPIASIAGIGTIASQNANAVTITGGNITSSTVTVGAAAATNTSTRALRVAGGAGIGGDLYVGGSVYSLGGAPLRNIQVSTNNIPPVSAAVGDVWYDSSSGASFQYINDGTSSFWIQFGTSFS